jgi:nicotinamide-nucleotide amidase
MNAPQQKQALLPSTCAPFANPVGTACGFSMRHERRHYLFMPGVPAEARAMTDFATGYINEHAGRRRAIISCQLRVFGLWESVIQEKLSGVPDPRSGVSLGYYPQFPEVILRLTGHGPDTAVLEERLEQARDAIKERIGGHIYAEGDETLAACAGKLLAATGSTVAVAESCTGGLLSHLVTSVPGSSGWFERGLVVYSNESKTQLAGVAEELLAQHGAVSAPVAQALAHGIRKHAASTWGIGITGIAGPGGGTPAKPVGTVFFAIAGPDGCRVHQRRFTGTREQVKTLSAWTALDLLRRALLGLRSDDQEKFL